MLDLKLEKRRAIFEWQKTTKEKNTPTHGRMGDLKLGTIVMARKTHEKWVVTHGQLAKHVMRTKNGRQPNVNTRALSPTANTLLRGGRNTRYSWFYVPGTKYERGQRGVSTDVPNSLGKRGKQPPLRSIEISVKDTQAQQAVLFVRNTTHNLMLQGHESNSPAIFSWPRENESGNHGQNRGQSRGSHADTSLCPRIQRHENGWRLATTQGLRNCTFLSSFVSHGNAAGNPR